MYPQLLIKIQVINLVSNILSPLSVLYKCMQKYKGADIYILNSNRIKLNEENTFTKVT